MESQAGRAGARASGFLSALLVTVLVVAGPVVIAPSANAQVGAPVTYQDHAYASTVVRPTEDKAQSKLWHHDGAWWALMVAVGGTTVQVHELLPDHTWRNTQTTVDDRAGGTGDVLLGAEGKAYVASRTATANLRVVRLAYDPVARNWTVDAGFPIEVNSGGGSESASIDQDSLGRLWVTYTRQSRVYVAHSDVGGTVWTAGFLPNVPDVVLSSDDISTIIAFDGRIGVMWSDQQSSADRFAIHRDTDPDDVWQVETALAGPHLADDHLNLKRVPGDARLFAAVKTAQESAGAGATLVGVLVRTPRPDGSGEWALAPAGTVADAHTRPVIAIDQSNAELYFFAAATGGDIYYKKTGLAQITFSTGRGAPFVDGPNAVVDATVARQPVTSQTGLVVLSVAEVAKRYVHAELVLAGATPGDTTPPTVPQALIAEPRPDRVDLSWQASTDDVGVTGYAVRRDGVEIATAAGTTYTDTSVVAGGSYSYTVQAFDAARNRSAPSAAAVATVTGTSGDGIVFRAATTAANGSATTLVLPTSPAAAGEVLLASVDVRGNPTIATPAGWQLVRQDVNGSTMRKATYVRVATDAEPPSYTWTFSTTSVAVGSMSAYSGVSTTEPIQASGGQINASSTAVSAPSVTTVADGAVVVGLFGLARSVGMVPPPGMVERTGVLAPAGAPFQIAAETADARQGTAGPTGGRVATAAAAAMSVGQLVALRPGPTGPAPVDTTPPSVPTSVVAVASAGRVDLSWAASSDDVGVTGYAVRRDGVEITSVPGTTYVDTAVSAGTVYTYTVEAFDAAANRSPASSPPVTVTVPDTPPPATIAFRGAATGTNGSATALDLPVPAATQAGDLMLATIDVRGLPTIVAPTGWQLVRQDSNSTTMRKATYWKVASWAEPSAYTWTLSRTTVAVGSVLAYSGVSPTAPISVAAGQVNPSGTSVTAPSVTVTSPGAVVGLFAVARTTTFSPPPETFERTDVPNPAGAPYQITAETADLLQIGAGATGNRVAAAAAAGQGIGQLIALTAAN